MKKIMIIFAISMMLLWIFQGIMFYQLYTLNRNFVSIQSRYVDYSMKLDELTRVSNTLDDQTIEFLSVFSDDYLETIEIYDKNVEIYNSQIQELYENVDNLNQRINLIADYLTGGL